MAHDHDHDHEATCSSAELLDLDGEALRSYWEAALELVHAAAGERVQRVLDLGAGSGVGTIALARLFGDGEILAVDVSSEMLDRISGKARALGLADRVRTVEADVDAGWPPVGTVDVTWASMSMHHFAEPDRVLAEVFAATRDAGVVAVAEFSDELRFLPDDLGIGRPGLEARCHELLRHEHEHGLPHLGSHWAPMLEAAGFAVVGEHELAIDDPGRSPAARRYALLWLQRLRSGFADRLADDDLDTLARLTDGDGPESVLSHDDLHIRGTRTVTIARRP
jgi:ubiquinone/menaquinone biosynthesis C-methylase UbiE